MVHVVFLDRKINLFTPIKELLDSQFDGGDYTEVDKTIWTPQVNISTNYLAFSNFPKVSENLFPLLYIGFAQLPWHAEPCVASGRGAFGL